MTDWPLTSRHSTELPRPGVWHSGDVQPLRRAFTFRGIAITETGSFPPAASERCWVYITLNAEIALTRRDDQGVCGVLRDGRARISVDSQWIWWALRRRHGARAPMKLSGSELIYTLAEHCATHGRSLLLLGASAETNRKAVDALRARHPHLNVSGFSPRMFRPGTPDEPAALAESLDTALATAADFVVLGFSPEKQYAMAAQLAPRLDGVSRGLLCFGGAIDMVSGRVKRAPVLWQRLGVESVYRILQQPSRLSRLFRLLPIVPQVLLGRY